MTSGVVVYHGVQLPAAHDPECDFVLRRCMSGAYRNNGGVLELINPPTASERRILSVRQSSLVLSLSGCDKKAVGAAVGEMLLCYPQFNRGKSVSKEEKQAFREAVTKYVQELADLPTWACQRACDDIRLGKAPDVSQDFPPSTIRVRALAEFYLVPIKAELNQIGEIQRGIEAPPQLSPEERKALGAKFQALSNEMEDRQKVLRQDDEARRRSFARQFSSRHEAFILAEWGKERPLYAAPGMVISKSLAQKLVRL